MNERVILFLTGVVSFATCFSNMNAGVVSNNINWVNNASSISFYHDINPSFGKLDVIYIYELKASDGNVFSSAPTVSTITINKTVMFYGSKSLANLDGLKDWDTSNVTDMSSMFNGVPPTLTRPSWYK